MRVITFSRFFPAHHPKAGQPTFFVEQIYNAIGLKIGTTKSSGDIPELMWDKVNDFVLLDGEMKKYHTIRAGNRWKVGDWFSPRVWTGKPYASKQIEFAPPVQIKKIWVFEMNLISRPFFRVDGEGLNNEKVDALAKNDGLSYEDFKNWLSKPKPIISSGFFKGQILCWNESIEYL